VDKTDTEIVGVVEDAAIWTLHDAPHPFLYFPFAQLAVSNPTFLVETAVEPGSLAAAVKREIRAANPAFTILNVSTLKRHLHEALYTEWLRAVLSNAVGAFGILLGAIGLFGVVMQSVNRQARELGIRTAIGARASTVVGMVIRRGLSLAGAGCLAGVGLSLAGGRVLAGWVYGLSPYDPVTLAFSVAAVLAVAAAASLYPAITAARIDPAAVLRGE
jgi:putative ABC transport system permease protein